MDKKIILMGAIALLIVMYSYSVEATPSYIFEKESDINLKASCFNEDDQICGAGTDCYLTVFKPDSSLLLDNVTMTNQGAFYNYSINSTESSTTGVYSAVVYCAGGVDSYGSFTFEITPNGEKPTEADSILYIGLFIILVLLFTLTVIGAFNSEGDEIKPTLMRLGLWNTSYLLLIAISFITWNIASSFLTSAPFLISMTYIIFRILMAMALPLVASSLIYIGYKMITIKEIQNMMDRGISMDEAKERRSKKW